MPRPPLYSLLILAGMITLYVQTSNSQPVMNNKIDSDSEEMDQWPVKEKRPFCNAFAGCGRKRSSGKLREAKVPDEKLMPVMRNHLHFSNNDVDKLLDKLFARLLHYRTSTGQTDSMDYK